VLKFTFFFRLFCCRRIISLSVLIEFSSDSWVEMEETTITAEESACARLARLFADTDLLFEEYQGFLPFFPLFSPLSPLLGKQNPMPVFVESRS
jgi:hypothetical protein